MTDTLFDQPAEREPSTHRVQSLAGVLAGFAWPERGSFEKLTKDQRETALTVARDALRRIGAS